VLVIPSLDMVVHGVGLIVLEVYSVEVHDI